MTKSDRAELYNELKAAGVEFDKHYREYTIDELAGMRDRLHEQPNFQREPVSSVEPTREEPPFHTTPQPPPEDVMPAEHAYSRDEEEPIRTDEYGNVWYREEVLKPAYPKPRARRVLRYLDPGVETKTVGDGRFTESFEIAGTGQRQAEVKITMPSFQVGVYRDPRFPFKIHTYGGNRGFDLFDVRNFYGGGDLVPAEIKMVYIANDLCYDMTSTIRAIQSEYRRNVLKEDR